MANHQASAIRVAELNDEFRHRGTGGSRYITAGIQAKGPEFMIRACAEVAAFNSFSLFPCHQLKTLTIPSYISKPPL